MHEVAVTREIVAACRERAGGARVLRVTLEVGALTCVRPESLRFCYAAATEGTPLAGSALEIVSVPATSRCRSCGGDVEVREMLGRCPCGSADLEAPRGGDTLRIRSIDVHES